MFEFTISLAESGSLLTEKAYGIPLLLWLVAIILGCIVLLVVVLRHRDFRFMAEFKNKKVLLETGEAAKHTSSIIAAKRTAKPVQITSEQKALSDTKISEAT